VKILVLGTGLQAKAALRDLARSPDVKQVIAADADLEELQEYAEQLPTGKISCT
jgi:saccharopine dehydrogenase-like NADP-dependent oxidoreductase